MKFLKFLKNIKNVIFWFLKFLLLNLLEFSAFLMLWLSCISLGYFVGIMLKTNSPLNLLIEIGVSVLFVSSIFFPFLQFYLIPLLRTKWEMPLINAKSFKDIGNRAFIKYYESKKDFMLLGEKNTNPSICNKESNDVLEQLLLKIPILKTFYIKKRDFEEKMKDSAFAIGYTLKWIKRKSYFGFALLFILLFIISTGIFILLPDYFFYILFSSFFIVSFFLPTLHIDLYILKKHYRQFDKERELNDKKKHVFF